MRKKLFLLICVIASQVFFSQNQDFHFRYLSSSDGLSNNSIIAIEQDHLGQLWFGTRNGLNKYNGHSFEVYRNDSSIDTSISNSDILSILEDQEGYIWVGTYSGLNRYDPKMDAFKRYTSSTKKEFLVNGLVICSTEMPNGELWFGTGNGISIYNKNTDNFTNVFYGSTKDGTRNYKNIQRIFCDSKGDIWVGHTKGLARLESRDEKEFSFEEFEWKLNDRNLFVQDIIELNSDVLGIATQFNGFLLFDTRTKEFKNSLYSEIPKNIDVRALRKDNEGNLWLGASNGVFVITTSNAVIKLTENRNSNSGISQNFIKTIFKDQTGSMWLGTYSGGASIWSRSNENFIHLKNNKLNNNVVNAVVSDGKSNLYFGTEGGAINVLDQKGAITTLLKVPDDGKELTYPIQTMLYTQPNLLWVGVLNHGIFVYDLSTKKEHKDIISNDLRSYLQNTGVFAIKKDLYGDFWFGTFGKGIVKYNIKTKKITKILRPNIPTNVVKTIQIDDEGRIWAGGLGSAFALELNEVGVYDMTKYFDERGGLTFNIKTIFKDSLENIWVGTNTRGLYKFDGKDFKKVKLNSEDSVSTVYTIIEEEKGVLWLSTDKGIVRYRLKDEKATAYDQRSISGDNEFSPNSGLALNGSQMFFGGLKGVTGFNTQKIVKNQFTPKVLLSSLKVKNKLVKVGPENILKSSLSFTKDITLDYDNSSFSIGYALPNYINTKGNKFAYRLIGLDANWTYTNQNEAFFTLQEAGTYIFEVKGGNYDDAWNKTVTSLNIVVKPAPWKTWWAYTIYILFIGVLLFMVYWMLQSKAKLKHKLELEYVEGKRNEELNKAKLQFFTNISHEFRTPLTLILGPLQQVLNDYNGSNSVYKKLKIIEGSANHLLRLINRLMDFRKLENDQFELEAAEGNIVKFLKEIFLSFTEYAKKGNYTYSFNTNADEVLIYYDRYKLERVFYNLISNAFRYTKEGGEIVINVEKNAEYVLIEVIDTGVGIADEFIDKIFDRFFEVPIHNRVDEHYNKGTGIGLSIANNIVKLHHGAIAVENVKPHGARFSVKLKKGKAHLSEAEIIKNFKVSDDVSQYASQIDIPKIKLNNDIGDLVLEEKEFTVLIVEDNKVLRSFMKEMLKQTYNVLQAENGKIAFEKAIKHMPDLIISDVIMPEMVGTELCSKIKTNLKTSHIPVILLTSRTSLVYRFEGLESGADDYISKPFNLKEFKLKVKNLINAKQRIKEKFSSDDDYSDLDVSLTSIDEELLKKAFKIVESNLSNEDFDIDLFSKELGVSRSMLFIKIKAWTNFTPKDFIQEIRLKRAARLLEIDKWTIAEVGYNVGFKRPKYFSKCFKEKYGLTPSEFSKKFATGH